jgi:hypothetical protein
LYLSGSVKAFKAVFLIAETMKAKAIHFITPNVIFIVAPNKEDYVYAKTSITVGESILLPQTSYRNMHLYLKAGRRGFKKEESLFYRKKLEGVTFTSEKIYFNYSESLAIETDIKSLLLRKKVEFKIEDTITSSYQLEAPYIRFSPELFEEINSELLKNKPKTPFKGINSVDNTIRVENKHLTFFFNKVNSSEKFTPKNQIFAIQDDSKNQIFSFNDHSVYFLRWLSRATHIEEYLLIPREHYCVTEGYHHNMVAKVRMSYQIPIDGGE